MYKHIPFNERKRNAQNFQTIISNNKHFKIFLNENENRVDTKNQSVKMSRREFKMITPLSRMTTDKKIVSSIESSKSIVKLADPQEKNFEKLNEKEKENFLKLRGRKLKDYIHEILNKNDVDDTYQEEEEKQIELFSFNKILNTEENENSNEEIIDCLKHVKGRNYNKNKRSQTSGPSKFKFKHYQQKVDEAGELIENLEYEQIRRQNLKSRKNTVSHDEKYNTLKKKLSIDKILENHFIPQKSGSNKKLSFSNLLNFDKSINLENSNRRNSDNKERPNLKLNTIRKLSTQSITKIPNEKDEFHRNEKTYLTYLNKRLSNNKLAFKNLLKPDNEDEIFKKDILDEQENRNLLKFQNVYDSLSDDENEEFKSCLIYPDSKFKEIWDYIILILTMYTLIFVPYDMAFIDEDYLIVIIIDLICDIIYIIDVVLQFLIPVSTIEDKYITSYYFITKNYLFSWFLVDLTSSLPLNSILIFLSYNAEKYEVKSTSFISDKITDIAKLSRLYRMMKLMRLLKFFKIAKSEKYATKNLNIFNTYMRSNLNRLFVFFIYFIIFNHMLACIWTFIGSLDQPNWIGENNMSDSSNLDLYIASIYFNLTTIFTIGFGDIKAINNYERMYNIIIMCVGIMIYTFAVSSLSNLIQKRDEKTVKYERNMNFLDEISIRYHINFKLFSKIKRCLSYDYTVNTEDKFNMLSNLPEIIKIELINNMHRELIHNFFFFKNTNAAFRAKILILMKPLKVIKGEVLIKENEYVEEMFFIKRGIMSIFKNYRGQPLKLVEIRKNEHFGEIFMMLHEKSLYDLVVKSKYAELYFLRKVDLLEVYAEYQDIFESILQKSTYNSLMILKGFKNKLRNIKKRKSVKIKTNQELCAPKSGKSMLEKFLNRDGKRKSTYQKKNSNLLDFTSKESQSKEIINYENPFEPNELNKIKKDFHTIFEKEEENEDDIKINSPRFEISEIKEKKDEIITSEAESNKLNKNKTKILEKMDSEEAVDNPRSLKSTTIKKSITDKLQHTISPSKETMGINNNIRTTQKRRYTGFINPSKNLSFLKLQENLKNMQSLKQKPQLPKRNPLEKANGSLNLQMQDKIIKKNTLFIHNEINKNIINDSMNINAPSMFYSNKFEKWAIMNQTKKLKKIFQKFIDLAENS